MQVHIFNILCTHILIYTMNSVAIGYTTASNDIFNDYNESLSTLLMVGDNGAF